MFSLTGSLLFWVATVGALAGPSLLVRWLRRTRRSLVVRTVLQWMAIATCQILALASLFFYINNAHGFHTSWSDLLRRSHTTAQIQTNGLIKPGQGRVELITVPGTTATGGAHQVLMWLPPEYTMPRCRDQQFPVLMMLPGQPSTPSATFRAFNSVSVPTQALAGGRIRPFIAVFPPFMTCPPRDTECTNISAGPQAET